MQVVCAVARASCDAEFLLHFFQGDASCFRIPPQDYEELDGHHYGEENERVASGFGGDSRKAERDDCIHGPVSEAAKALACGADAVGKNFADVDPDDGALG